MRRVRANQPPQERGSTAFVGAANEFRISLLQVSDQTLPIIVLPLADAQPHREQLPSMKAGFKCVLPMGLGPGWGSESSRTSAAAAAGMRASWTPVWLAAHAVPALVLMVLGSVLMSSQADHWLADRLYAWQGHRWAFRAGFVAETMIHLGGRDLSIVAWLGVLAAWTVAQLRIGLSTLRTPLACLLVSMLLATALVSWIKSWSNVDCPWDLARYGGTREYVGLLALRPLGVPHATCFPAGHAGAGYAWTASYFFFLATWPRWRWLGLAMGIVLGVVFGATQQLRGAHFLSHDLWTAAICWACALGGYLVLPRVFRCAADRRAIADRLALAPRRAASWPLRTEAK